MDVHTHDEPDYLDIGMKPVLTYLDRWFARFGPAPLVAASLIMVSFIGVIRWVSGPEVAFSAFFLVPIILSTWYAGRRIGILVSILSIMIWLAADLMLPAGFSNPAIPLINQLLRLLVFLFVAMTANNGWIELKPYG